MKEALLRSGAEGACMSGSGSAVFGIFPNVEAAEKAAEKIDLGTKIAVCAI